MGLHGLCILVLENRATGLDSTFKEQLASYLLHFDSDHDLWEALLSGCFLDHVYYPPGESDFPPGHRPYPYEIRDWWTPSEPLPTAANVLTEWGTVRAKMAASVRYEQWLGPSSEEEVKDIMRKSVDVIDGHIADSKHYQKAVARSRIRLQEIMGEWVALGIDTPTPPLRMF